MFIETLKQDNQFKPEGSPEQVKSTIQYIYIYMLWCALTYIDANINTLSKNREGGET